MPKYLVTAPNGDRFQVTAPEGATQDQVLAYAKAHHDAPMVRTADADARARVSKTPDRVRAVARGASFNFVDKLDGAQAALETAVSRATGRDVPYTPGEAYNAVVRANQDAAANYTAKRPVSGTAYELAGGLFVPGLLKGGKWASEGKTLLDLMRRGAIVGGAAGGAYGAGGAAPGKEVEGTVRGTAAGAALGFVVPPALAVGGRAINAASRPALAALAQRFPEAMGEVGVRARAAATGPEVRAARALEEAINSDKLAGHTADLAKPLRHSGGENVAALYDVVAQSPGPGRQAMKTAVEEHANRTSDMIRSDIGEVLGGRGDYFATEHAMAADRAAAGKPLVAEAFAEPIPTATFDEKFGPILARLPKGALEEARDIARKAGKNPDELGLTMLDSFDGQTVGAGDDLSRLEAHAGGDTLPMSGNVQARTVTPTLETLHYVKKGIDQTLEKYRNQVSGRLNLSGSPGAQADAKVRGDLVRAMRSVSPKYEKAMAKWGDDSDHLDALKLGRDVFSGKFDMQSENLRALHAEMSEESKAQFRKGVGEAIIAEVRRKGDVSAVRRLLTGKSEEFRDRVALAFNDNPAAFEAFLIRMGERADQAARDARFMGGSPSYARLAARAKLEEEGPGAAELVGNMVGGPRMLAGKALIKAAKALPGKPKSAIADPASNLALGRSSADPEEVKRLLNIMKLERRVKLSRAQGAVAPLLAGPATNR